MDRVKALADDRTIDERIDFKCKLIRYAQQEVQIAERRVQSQKRLLQELKQELRELRKEKRGTPSEDVKIYENALARHRVVTP